MGDREFMRKMLDEVLGADRNKLPDQSANEAIQLYDQRVCRRRLPRAQRPLMHSAV